MKTTANIPPSVAAEYAKAPRASAVAAAGADGYAKPPVVPKGKSQFGLPKSSKKPPMRMKADRDKDGM